MRTRKQITRHYDVVVIGGGLAGVCAAVAAARHGAKTAIVQARSVFGGVSSSEIRMHICGATCHEGKKDLAESGILLEMLLKNKSRNPTQSFSVWDTVLWETVRYQENLDSYLNTSFEHVVMEGDRIAAVECSQITTEREYIFTARIFVDATGNGTLGYLAGADYRMGSESRAEFGEPDAPEQADHYTMGNTVLFVAEDQGQPVPFQKPFWAHTFTDESLGQRGHGNMTKDRGKNGIVEEYSADSGYWWIEYGGESEDIIDSAEDIAEELKKCVFGVWDHIKNAGDHGAANHAIQWIGTVPGMRESRRLEGDYILTEQDVLENRVFPDAVAYGGWPMDRHDPGGIHSTAIPSDHINFPGAYTIPYRCYYSRNISNLMMAGRDISASKMAFSSSRVMATCAIGGQAVGTAAAMAAAKGCTPRELGGSVRQLQQALLKDDCYIPGCRSEDEADLAAQASVTATGFQTGSEPERILSGVSRRVGEDSHCWESRGIAEEGETLRLSFETPVSFRQLRLYFDPDFSGEIMPSLTAKVLRRQCKGLPPVLVRDYEVRAFLQGKPVWQQTVRDNIQRLNILNLPEETRTDCVEITVRSTHGYENARIFEVRMY